jgi:predicted Zn-dependent protease
MEGMEFSKDDQRRLEAALGFFDLDMCDEALQELREIAPDRQESREVLSISLAVHQRQKRWKEARELARDLASLFPEEPCWFIAWAFAARRAESIVAARVILLYALKQHPEDATIYFNLGCYAAQLGELEEAKSFVREAVERDSSLKRMAEEDPDLEPLRAQPQG